MPEEITVRAAIPADVPAIMTVLEAAKQIMREDGNLHQWVDGHPSEALVRGDIALGQGYVMLERDAVVAYFVFMRSPEPSYAAIDGQWLDDTRPYHVIHRLGSLPDVHGVFRTVMDWSFSRDGNIRIDTHRDNSIMRHCIGSYGFTYCGIIYLASGDERLAYQKIICQR